MAAYYNEIDPYAVEWLRNLIAAGHIADGAVDDRSIVDVQPEDLKGFTQCHFFAGIGGWSHALRLARWADDRPVWTGSPPCQPFSTAGKQLGHDDPRHLAPHWLELVVACRPVTVFGEQVAAAVKKDNWLDTLQDVLEAENYATGAVVLPACGVGAPHLRQRLWIVAQRLADTQHHDRGANQSGRESQERIADGGRGKTVGLADTQHHGRNRPQGYATEPRCNREDKRLPDGDRTTSVMADTLRTTGRQDTRGALGNENQDGGSGRHWGEQDSNNGLASNGEIYTTDAPDSFWSAADWLGCRDGKWRPVEPGTLPLAHGVPARVGKLRAYGNAIVPQVAAEVIKAFCQTEKPL